MQQLMKQKLELHFEILAVVGDQCITWIIANNIKWTIWDNRFIFDSRKNYYIF